MPMPKGYKKETGYGSSKSLGGMSYHQIADTMNDQNFKMNHSTARNVFVNGLVKIAGSITKIQGHNFDYKKLKSIAIDPRFQEAIAEYMKETEYDRSQGNNK